MCVIPLQENQAQSNPLGSGLGYLEHICQLIEKIGQLQEHNLKLQKQICSLHKDSKMMKTKEVGSNASHLFLYSPVTSIFICFICNSALTVL